ncbi:hypothetical protein D3C78_1873520 [compost metagenome]
MFAKQGRCRGNFARVDPADRLEKEIQVIELRLKRCLRESPDCQKIAEIPGIVLLTATAAVASLGDSTTFRSGR